MTQAVYTEYEGRHVFILNGHAGDRDVCNALSILASTLVTCLHKAEEEGGVKDIVELGVDETDGFLYIGFRPVRVTPLVIINTILQGVILLADSYPESVSISETLRARGDRPLTLGKT
jgi:uncharacterized protein YsxB (DUF464 family)